MFLFVRFILLVTVTFFALWACAPVQKEQSWPVSTFAPVHSFFQSEQNVQAVKQDSRSEVARKGMASFDNIIPVESVLSSSINPEFAQFTAWAEVDLTPALLGFDKTCQAWASRGEAEWLDKRWPFYGRLRDWRPACHKADALVRKLNKVPLTSKDKAQKVRAFFENNFAPAPPHLPSLRAQGLLTGYYAPALSVRFSRDEVYSEPILATPAHAYIRKRPRSQLNAFSAPVLAYGKAIDVFFLQIQGSGRVKFPNNEEYAVLYDANNGHEYRSIGRVLIERGVLQPNQSSKQDIENWLEKATPRQRRDLFNKNPRYIFFKAYPLQAGEAFAPKGAMGVELSAMGSVAADSRHYPYGALVWMETYLPRLYSQKPSFHKNTANNHKLWHANPVGMLVNIQDTGKAIKGKGRGDLYFGEGTFSGLRAGKMKYQAQWHVLLPRTIGDRNTQK